jgi:hypothetical protein
MSKTYSSQSNAIRAARAELGPEAIPGADFHLSLHDRGRFSFTVGPAPEKTEQPKAARVAKAPTDPNAPLKGKAADLVAKLKSREGITTEEVRAMTGWSKIGGFYGAAKRAELVLHSVRELGTTRYFGADAGTVQAIPGVIFAYIRHEPGGCWTRLGNFGTLEFAVKAAPEDYAWEEGRTGGLFFSPRCALGMAA